MTMINAFVLDKMAIIIRINTVSYFNDIFKIHSNVRLSKAVDNNVFRFFAGFNRKNLYASYDDDGF